MSNKTCFVGYLPDLIQPEEYANHPKGELVRLQIRLTPEGIEILGDAMRPDVLERLLNSLNVNEIEQMLCG